MYKGKQIKKRAYKIKIEIKSTLRKVRHLGMLH